MLNIGFIGFGKSATRYHLPYLLNRTAKLCVKKIFSPIVDESMISSLGLNETIFCQSLDDLLDSDDVEMITICTPPTTHYELAMKVLKSGKHVLVEKPFCSNTTEAEEIFSYARSQNLIAMPYQNRRFDSEVIAAKKAIESKELGDIFEVEFHFDRYRPLDERPMGTVYDGEFYGLGVHLLDKAVYLFGIPDKVFYDIRTLRKKGNPDDTFEMQLFYSNKKIILKVNQLIISEYPTLRINGTTGSFIKYGMDTQETYLKSGTMPNEFGFGIDKNPILLKKSVNDIIEEFAVETPIGDYGKVYDAMYESIKFNKPKLVSDVDTIATLKILSLGIEKDTPFIEDIII